MADVRVFSDFDIEMSNQNDGDLKRMTEVEAIKNSLNNISQTLQGSRRMLPEFARPFQELLFEPMDETTAYRLGSMLLEAINVWDDRVIVEGINVNANHDINRYEVTLDFRVVPSEQQEVETIELIIQQG